MYKTSKCSQHKNNYGFSHGFTNAVTKKINVTSFYCFEEKK